MPDVDDGSFFRGPAGGVSPWARVTPTPRELVVDAHTRGGVTDQ